MKRKMKSEDEVDRDLVLEAAKIGIKLMRNNRGQLRNQFGTPVSYGLGNTGKDNEKDFLSSDRIAIVEIVITPEMVGKKIGVFAAIEVKSEDWVFTGTKREIGQKNFIDFVISKGGIGGFAKSVDDLHSMLKKLKLMLQG